MEQTPRRNAVAALAVRATEFAAQRDGNARHGGEQSRANCRSRAGQHDRQGCPADGGERKGQNLSRSCRRD